MKGLIVVTLLLLLAGCGGKGGGNGDAMPDDEIMQLASDPRVMRLEGIVERTTTLLIPGVNVRYSILGETTTKSFQEISCSGDTCAGTGVTLNLTATILTDLIDPNIDISVSEANLQSRDDGFDTAFIEGSLDTLDIGALFPEITIDQIPEGFGYGFWGEHGMAGLSFVDGPFSGRVTNIPFSGDMTVAIPFALGDVSGSNPGRNGSATWTGIAEVVAIRTFRRQEGIATLTIPDLLASTLTVSVGIDVAGNPIGKPGWTKMPLAGGRFMFKDAGDDYLEGNFHGADHSEAYGVFDTDNFTGSFGAKRVE